jgi:hypothetical protein
MDCVCFRQSSQQFQVHPFLGRYACNPNASPDCHCCWWQWVGLCLQLLGGRSAQSSCRAESEMVVWKRMACGNGHVSWSEDTLYTWQSRRQVPRAAWGLGLRSCEYVGIISLYFNLMRCECVELLRLSTWHEFEAILCCTMDERSLQGRLGLKIGQDLPRSEYEYAARQAGLIGREDTRGLAFDVKRQVTSHDLRRRDYTNRYSNTFSFP